MLESIARVGAGAFAAGLVFAAPQSVGVAQADATDSETGASASAAAGQPGPETSAAESVQNAELGSSSDATALADSGDLAAGQDSVAEPADTVPADVVEELAAVADLAEEAAVASDVTAVAASGDLAAGQDSVAESAGTVPADVVEELAAVADLAEEAAVASDVTAVAAFGDLAAGQDSVAESAGTAPADSGESSAAVADLAEEPEVTIDAAAVADSGDLAAAQDSVAEPAGTAPVDIVEPPTAAADLAEEAAVALPGQEGNQRPPPDPDWAARPLRSSPATDPANVGDTAAVLPSEGATTEPEWTLQNPAIDSASSAMATSATSDAAASSMDEGVESTQAARPAIRIRDVLHTVVVGFLDAVSDGLSGLPANPFTELLQAAWLSLRRNLFNQAPVAEVAHWSSTLADDTLGLGTSGTAAAPTATLSSTPAAETPAYAADEVLVTWKPGTSALARALAMDRVRATAMASMSTKEMLDTDQGAAYRLKVNVGTAAAIEALSKNPAVAFVEPNYKLLSTAAVTSTNDPYYTSGSLWGMYSDDSPTAYGPSGTTNAFGSGAEEAWGQGYTGSPSVVVAVLDEGIQITHPDLAANIWANPYETAGDGIDNDGNGYVDDVNGWDFYYGDNTVYDAGEDAHGTHVGGTIGGVGGNGIGVSGVSPNVQIISTKFLGPQGGYTSDAIAAIDYLTDLKTRHNVNLAAINNSWGGGEYSSALHSAILRAAKADILFVAAAGNETVNTDTTASWPSNYSTLEASATESAASYESVISVASITSTGALSWFSNYGASTVDIGAPGSAILSTVPGGYESYNGTSMAAPHVTGAIALLKSFSPTSTAADLRTAILGNARATTSLTGKTVTGGTLSMEGLFTVTPPPNTAPTAVDDGPFTVTAGESLTVTYAQLVGNDTDPDLAYGDALAVNWVWAPTGAVVHNDAAAKTVTYTPAPDHLGERWFAYRAKDSAGTTSANYARVTVEVPPPWAPNSAPTVVDDGPFTVSQGQSLTLTHAQLLGNDTDPDLAYGDALAVNWVWAPTGAVVHNDAAAKTVTYTPAPDHLGERWFAYRAKDSAGTTSADYARVTVEVLPSNSAPTVVDDGPFTVSQGQSLTLTHEQLLGNDTDPDLVNGDALAVNWVWAPTGAVVHNDAAAKTVTYTPAADHLGERWFAYWAKDSAGTSSADYARVTVEVSPPWAPNSAPTVVDDGPFTVSQGQSLTLTYEQLVGNDTDPDLAYGDALAVNWVWAPTGAVVHNDAATRTVTYTPAADHLGERWFAYWAEDSAGTSSADYARVTVEVSPPWAPNSAPTAVDDGPFTVGQGEALTLTYEQLVGNDTDPDLAYGDALAVNWVWAPTGAVVHNDAATRTVTYTPAADDLGERWFAYGAKDSAGAVSDYARVTVEVQPRPALGIYPTTFAPLATTGTSVVDCDDCTSGLVPIGFTFRFFDTDYTQINISSNGFVGFSPTMDHGCCSGRAIPSADILGGIIAAAWTDLRPSTSPLAPNSVTYETRGSAANRVFVVSFTQVPLYPNVTPDVTTQIVLHENTNAIEIFTTTQEGGSRTWSQGVISPDGLTGYSLPGRSAQTYSLTNDAVIIYTNAEVLPPLFQAADWLWNPISADAVLAADSETWVNYLSEPGAQHVANLHQYGVTLVPASEITSSTTRYDVAFTKPWGSDPFGTSTVAIPAGTKIPPGSDGHIAVLDPTTGQAFGIWQAKYNSTTDTWSGSWGGATPLDGNGVDQTGSATATGLSRYAGVVTAAEFSDAVDNNTGINHALFFSTDIAGPDFVGPAIKSDGSNIAGVATPIPEGARVQLDPSIDVDAIPGITEGEKVIAKTLQTHGAYVGDQGSARMAFMFESVPDATSTNPGAVYVDAGLAWDYYDMQNIPWSMLRVIAN